MCRWFFSPLLLSELSVWLLAEALCVMQPVRHALLSIFEEMFLTELFCSLKAICHFSHIFFTAQGSPRHTSCFVCAPKSAINEQQLYTLIFFYTTPFSTSPSNEPMGSSSCPSASSSDGQVCWIQIPKVPQISVQDDWTGGKGQGSEECREAHLLVRKCWILQSTAGRIVHQNYSSADGASKNRYCELQQCCCTYFCG